MFERQVVWRALSRAWAKTGKRIAARMAMIAITTRSSINVKPCRRRTALVLPEPKQAFEGGSCLLLLLSRVSSQGTGNLLHVLPEPEASRVSAAIATTRESGTPVANLSGGRNPQAGADGRSRRG